MRLIDADKLLNDMKRNCIGNCDRCDEHTILSSDLHCGLVDRQPTIQPQGNRGKWIRYEDTHENSVKYICPFCGDYTAFRGEISESTVNGNYIYCRHCGAKNGEDQ